MKESVEVSISVGPSIGVGALVSLPSNEDLTTTNIPLLSNE